MNRSAPMRRTPMRRTEFKRHILDTVEALKAATKSLPPRARSWLDRKGRSILALGAPERAPKRGRRPGRPVDYGKRWRARAAAARARDSYACRICGHAIGVKGGHVDHIVPRRLLGRSRAEIEDATNLALLCPEHHAHKTQTIEPLLYGGRNLQPFHRYLETLARTGPVPSAELIGRALERAAAALRRPKP